MDRPGHRATSCSGGKHRASAHRKTRRRHTERDCQWPARLGSAGGLYAAGNGQRLCPLNRHPAGSGRRLRAGGRRPAPPHQPGKHQRRELSSDGQCQRGCQGGCQVAPCQQALGGPAGLLKQALRLGLNLPLLPPDVALFTVGTVAISGAGIAAQADGDAWGTLPDITRSGRVPAGSLVGRARPRTPFALRVPRRQSLPKIIYVALIMARA